MSGPPPPSFFRSGGNNNNNIHNNNDNQHPAPSPSGVGMPPPPPSRAPFKKSLLPPRTSAAAGANNFNNFNHFNTEAAVTTTKDAPPPPPPAAAAAVAASSHFQDTSINAVQFNEGRFSDQTSSPNTTSTVAAGNGTAAAAVPQSEEKKSHPVTSTYTPKENSITAATPVDEAVCDICGKQCKNRKGVTIHKSIMHKEGSGSRSRARSGSQAAKERLQSLLTSAHKTSTSTSTPTQPPLPPERRTSLPLPSEGEEERGGTPMLVRTFPTQHLTEGFQLPSSSSYAPTGEGEGDMTLSSHQNNLSTATMPKVMEKVDPEGKDNSREWRQTTEEEEDSLKVGSATFNHNNNPSGEGLPVEEEVSFENPFADKPPTVGNNNHHHHNNLPPLPLYNKPHNHPPENAFGDGPTLHHEQNNHNNNRDEDDNNTSQRSGMATDYTTPRDHLPPHQHTNPYANDSSSFIERGYTDNKFDRTRHTEDSLQEQNPFSRSEPLMQYTNNSSINDNNKENEYRRDSRRSLGSQRQLYETSPIPNIPAEEDESPIFQMEEEEEMEGERQGIANHHPHPQDDNSDNDHGGRPPLHGTAHEVTRTAVEEEEEENPFADRPKTVIVTREGDATPSIPTSSEAAPQRPPLPPSKESHHTVEVDPFPTENPFQRSTPTAAAFVPVHEGKPLRPDRSFLAVSSLQTLIQGPSSSSSSSASLSMEKEASLHVLPRSTNGAFYFDFMLQQLKQSPFFFRVRDPESGDASPNIGYDDRGVERYLYSLDAFLSMQLPQRNTSSIASFTLLVRLFRLTLKVTQDRSSTGGENSNIWLSFLKRQLMDILNRTYYRPPPTTTSTVSEEEEEDYEVFLRYVCRGELEEANDYCLSALRAASTGDRGVLPLPYKCLLCAPSPDSPNTNNSFLNEEAYRAHRESTHFICTICGYEAENDEHLFQHKEAHQHAPPLSSIYPHTEREKEEEENKARKRRGVANASCLAMFIPNGGKVVFCYSKPPKRRWSSTTTTNNITSNNNTNNSNNINECPPLSSSRPLNYLDAILTAVMCREKKHYVQSIEQMSNASIQQPGSRRTATTEGAVLPDYINPLSHAYSLFNQTNTLPSFIITPSSSSSSSSSSSPSPLELFQRNKAILESHYLDHVRIAVSNWCPQSAPQLLRLSEVLQRHGLVLPSLTVLMVLALTPAGGCLLRQDLTQGEEEEGNPEATVDRVLQQPNHQPKLNTIAAIRHALSEMLVWNRSAFDSSDNHSRRDGAGGGITDRAEGLLRALQNNRSSYYLPMVGLLADLSEYCAFRWMALYRGAHTNNNNPPESWGSATVFPPRPLQNSLVARTVQMLALLELGDYRLRSESQPSSQKVCLAEEVFYRLFRGPLPDGTRRPLVYFQEQFPSIPDPQGAPLASLFQLIIILIDPYFKEVLRREWEANPQGGVGGGAPDAITDPINDNNYERNEEEMPQEIQSNFPGGSAPPPPPSHRGPPLPPRRNSQGFQQGEEEERREAMDDSALRQAQEGAASEPTANYEEPPRDYNEPPHEDNNNNNNTMANAPPPPMARPSRPPPMFKKSLLPPSHTTQQQQQQQQQHPPPPPSMNQNNNNNNNHNPPSQVPPLSLPTRDTHSSPTEEQGAPEYHQNNGNDNNNNNDYNNNEDQGNAAGENNNNNNNNNTSEAPTRGRTAETQKATPSKRGGSLDAILSFFRRGRSGSQAGEEEGENKKGTAVCDKCGKSFNNGAALASHKNKAHPPKPMILNTDPLPVFNKETGKWEFEKTEEEKKLEEMVKQGPPRPSSMSRAPSAATPGGSENNNNNNNNSAAPPTGATPPPRGRPAKGPRYASVF